MAVEDEVGNPYIEAVDLDFTKDTLFLNYTEYFIFNFNVNKEILNVKFFLNGTEQYQSTNNSGSFKFKKGQLSKGQYRLTMEILVKSGTGSIADKVGAEGYILTKEWILKISGDYLSQVKNYVQDGYLVLDWPEYLSSDFVQYVVCKQTVGYPGYEEIKRLRISQFVDSTYV
ncbi:MAG: hypothetical protein ACOC0R_06515, partial [Mariniphaga sp.]